MNKMRLNNVKLKKYVYIYIFDIYFLLNKRFI